MATVASRNQFGWLKTKNAMVIFILSKVDGENSGMNGIMSSCSGPLRPPNPERFAHIVKQLEKKSEICDLLKEVFSVWEHCQTKTNREIDFRFAENYVKINTKTDPLKLKDSRKHIPRFLKHITSGFKLLKRVRLRRKVAKKKIHVDYESSADNLLSLYFDENDDDGDDGDLDDDDGDLDDDDGDLDDDDGELDDDDGDLDDDDGDLDDDDGDLVNDNEDYDLDDTPLEENPQRPTTCLELSLNLNSEWIKFSETFQTFPVKPIPDTSAPQASKAKSQTLDEFDEEPAVTLIHEWIPELCDEGSCVYCKTMMNLVYTIWRCDYIYDITIGESKLKKVLSKSIIKPFPR